MAGRPITRAKKAAADERRAERAANGGKRTVRNPTPAKKVAAKKAAAQEALAKGEELDFGGFTKQTWADWVDEFCRTGRQDLACKKAGIPRQTVYRRTRQDVEFEALVKEVRDMTLESLEDAAIRRARDGVLEPNYNRFGDLIGHTRKYSDSLLQFMLIHGRPEKYRPKKDVDLNIGSNPASKPPTINLVLNRPQKAD